MKIAPPNGPVLAGSEVTGPWTAVRGVVFNYIDTRVISVVAWAGFAQDPADYDKTVSTFSALTQCVTALNMSCAKNCAIDVQP